MRSRFPYVKALLIVSALSVSAFALDGWRVGLKAGANLSSLWGQGVTDFEDALAGDNIDGRMLWSFAGGLYTTFEFVEDFFALQPEVLYRRIGRGWDADFAAAAGQSFSVYTDYITIPVLAKFSLPLDFFVTPFAYAGPELLIAFRSRADNVAGLPIGEDVGFVGAFDQADIFDNVNNPDFGLVLGLGANMEMGPGQIELDFRYNFGFLNVYDVPGGDNVRNSAFTFMLGYSLGF